MVLLGGILIDIIGPNKISTIFCGVAVISTIISASSLSSYKGLLIGRFILGSGGEMLLSCAATMVPMWFLPNEIPLAMGALYSIIYWGNLASLLVLPRIRASFGLEAAFWFIVGVFIFGFILNSLLIKFGKRLKWDTNTNKNKNKNTNSISSELKIKLTNTISSEDIIIQNGDTSNGGGSGVSTPNFIIRIPSSTTTTDDMDSEYNDIGVDIESSSDDSSASSNSGNNSPRGAININIDKVSTSSVSSADQESDEEINNIIEIKKESPFREFLNRVIEIKDQSKKLSKRFWLLSLICFFGYLTMFGFAIIGTDVLKIKFGYDEKKAANYMAAEAIVNSILPIFTGWFIINLRGRKIQIMAFASFLLGMGVLLLNVTNANPLPWIIMCGVGFSFLNTTLMSCVPLLVDMSIVGTAYGIVTTAYNINIMAFPPLLDYVKQSTGSYTISLAILSMSSVVTIMLLALLKYWDLQVPLSQSLDSPLTTINNNDLLIENYDKVIDNDEKDFNEKKFENNGLILV
ncbi:hypothetical protein DDB_G0274547 [Dictyostelium discoideum AX4]|uniref:Lysosomal dipeptide transporter MFSD1 n=1 Tax=Dictyostelium discoideum TaxID=44689 RepID=Q8MP22_DICDI|nr:hypothetical protein DDB_G0274547 [Dictyostelium discoideum AX4]AAM44375.1 hypothetical protein [Dictyostelium discoideum]EAL70166.1 hypothetical protein DDB_G0274547 [Dictyostelium discoideum AX4]|eukprot:XP_644043.1 hypothetical protein DDB_G0274547 [Dictyostelium discoideum AX4]